MGGPTKVNIATPYAHDAPAPIPRQPALFTLAVVSMCLPVTLFARAGVELAPIDVIGPITLATLLVTGSGVRKSPQGSTFAGLLWLTVIIAFCAMLYRGSAATEGGAPRQFAAFAFTLRPILFLGIGLVLSHRPWATPERIIRTMGTAASFTCISVAFMLIRTGTPHHQYGEVAYGGATQFGEHLGGSLFGLPLYARYGVNSLAETYAVYGILALAALATFSRQRMGTWPLSRLALSAWYAFGTVSAGYLCLTSLSRQAILLWIAVVGAVASVFLIRRLLRANYGQALGLLTIMAAVGGVFGLQRLLVAISADGGLNSFTAGRVGILDRAVTQVLLHPLTGTGFVDDDAAEFNSHNLLLNLMLKMGIPAAVCFISLLLNATLPALRRLRRGNAGASTLIVDLGWCTLFFVVGLVSNSIDVITASGVLLLLLGLHRAHVPEQA